MAKKIVSKKFVKFGLIFIALLGLGLGGFVYKTQSAETIDESITIKEEKVSYGDIKIDFVGDGEAEIPVVNLDFEISGELKELYVTTGQEIKEGDVVAKLDDTDYVRKLESAKVDYQKAVAKLEQTKQNYELELIAEKQKIDDLKSKLDQVSAEYLPMLEIQEVYSKQAIELKKASYESAKSAYETQLEKYNIILKENKNIDMEKANVEGAKIALDIAKDNLEKTILTAPMDAKILTISYKPGETIPTVQQSSEATSDTSHFMVISDADKVKVVVPVSEIDLGNVAIDQKVEVEFEAFEGEAFTGTVVSIDSLPLIDNNGLVTYDVTIQLENGLDKIKTGMTCTVSFILNQRKDVLVISNKAVSIVDGQQVVQVKDNQGNIENRIIKTGFTDGKNVEVIEGLEIGETLIVEDNK